MPISARRQTAIALFAAACVAALLVLDRTPSSSPSELLPMIPLLTHDQQLQRFENALVAEHAYEDKQKASLSSSGAHTQSLAGVAAHGPGRAGGDVQRGDPTKQDALLRAARDLKRAAALEAAAAGHMPSSSSSSSSSSATSSQSKVAAENKAKHKQHLPSMSAAEARKELNGYFEANAPVTKKEKEEAAKKEKRAEALRVAKEQADQRVARAEQETAAARRQAKAKQEKGREERKEIEAKFEGQSKAISELEGKVEGMVKKMGEEEKEKQDAEKKEREEREREKRAVEEANKAKKAKEEEEAEVEERIKASRMQQKQQQSGPTAPLQQAQVAHIGAGTGGVDVARRPIRTAPHGKHAGGERGGGEAIERSVGVPLVTAAEEGHLPGVNVAAWNDPRLWDETAPKEWKHAHEGGRGASIKRGDMEGGKQLASFALPPAAAPPPPPAAPVLEEPAPEEEEEEGCPPCGYLPDCSPNPKAHSRSRAMRVWSEAPALEEAEEEAEDEGVREKHVGGAGSNSLASVGGVAQGEPYWGKLAKLLSFKKAKAVPHEQALAAEDGSTRGVHGSRRLLSSARGGKREGGSTSNLASFTLPPAAAPPPPPTPAAAPPPPPPPVEEPPAAECDACPVCKLGDDSPLGFEDEHMVKSRVSENELIHLIDEEMMKMSPSYAQRRVTSGFSGAPVYEVYNDVKPTSRSNPLSDFTDETDEDNHKRNQVIGKGTGVW